MTLHLVPVKSVQDQEKLAELAGQIWREYWPAHIGAAQTEYMIEHFQSLEAIKRQMAFEDYEYWFAFADEEDLDDDAAKASPWGRLVGFTGGHNEPETNRFFISKIYLLDSARGHGFARRIINFYDALCQTRDFDAMYLTVNKYNDLGTRAYFGTGFKIVDAVETDIGGGFIMDDYIMQKEAGQPIS